MHGESAPGTFNKKDDGMHNGRFDGRFLTALLLHFFSVAGIVLSRTYIDLLFLSTYPRSYLPYFFLGQTLIVLLLVFGITPMISKGSHVVNFYTLAVLAGTIFLSKILLSFHLPGFAFGLSLWLSALSVLVGVISWNTVGDAFDIRTFKRCARWINSAGSLGGLLFGLLIPVVIAFSGAETLLYVLGAVTILAAGATFMLKPLPVSAKKLKKGASPFKYPLFKTLFVSVFILMIVDTFADYALKSEIGAVFSKEEIGRFMGPFYGISNVLTLAIQLGGTNVLLKYFGLAVLLSVLPVFSMVLNAGIFIYPGIWLAAAFRMGEMVFRYSLDNIGCEIAANPLPGQIRRAGKLFMKGIATPLGTGVAALILWLAAEQSGLRLIALATIAVSIAWLVVIRKIKSGYQTALKEAIQIKRFAKGGEEATQSVLQATRNVALHALKEDTKEAIEFGLTALEDLYPEKLPEPALRHIDSPHSAIRAALAKTAGRLRDKKAVPIFIRRLQVEQDSEVTWRLLEALSVIAPEPAVPRALELLESPAPEIKAGAVLVLFAAGDLDALIEAGTTLRRMVYSDDPEMRKGAARAISSFRAGKLKKELELLLEDSDEDVCITAIRAVGVRRTFELAGVLAAKLGNGRMSRYASRTLVELGLPAAENLVDIITHEGHTRSAAAIRTLCMMADTGAEDWIIKAVESGRTIARTVLARESALRARRQAVSDVFRASSRRFLTEAFDNIQTLKAALASSVLAEHARAEISARRKLFDMQFFYWFAVCTRKPAEVIDIVPVLLIDSPSQALSARRAAAIEFLDSVAPDNILKNTVARFDSVATISSADALDKLKRTDDLWLRRVLTTEPAGYSGGEMDITQKVILLRKTSLFQHLPGEILLTIAEECEDREMIHGEKIFSQGDAPDGLYIIAAGQVNVKRFDQTISRLSTGDFFGEIGLLDDSARIADIIAESDGRLLFIEKEIFDAITEDLPEVLRAVTRTVIGYLKKR